MRTIIIFLLVTFFSFGQKQVEEKTEDYERVYIEVGVFNALSTLKEKASLSPNLGFWLKTKISKEESVDLGFNLSYLKAKENFEYQQNDTLFVSKTAGVSGMVGVRYNINYKLSKTKNISLDWFPSFGYGFLTHKPVVQPTRNITEVTMNRQFLSTVHLGQGIRFNIDNIGFQIQYQYVPYNLFYKNLDKNFGSQSIVFGLVYRQ